MLPVGLRISSVEVLPKKDGRDELGHSPNREDRMGSDWVVAALPLSDLCADGISLKPPQPGPRKMPENSCWHPSSVAGRPHPGTLGSFKPYKCSTVRTASSKAPSVHATGSTALAAVLSLFLFKGVGAIGSRYKTPAIRERRCSPSYDPLERTEVEITGTTVPVMRSYLLSPRAIVSHTVAGTEPWRSHDPSHRLLHRPP